ncbi:helix-turn-helix domain-containing protein [Criibacterium bergeronii]|uniref:Helix-turn-helix domain-containing protein n=2 Tax=Criibacterium bergeronii TaxID=1871336 RepID=A0A371IKY6_9FIRM|nr:helix-turn-helix domain-containing protein [Criibacterium bergeronii]
MQLRAEGMKVQEIAKILKVSRITISIWTKKFKEKGLEELKSKKQQGNRRNIRNIRIQEEKNF